MTFVQVKGGVFDEKYVLSSRVRTGRSIKGYCLPPFCNRQERRKVWALFTGRFDLDFPRADQVFQRGEVVDGYSDGDADIDDDFRIARPYGYIANNIQQMTRSSAKHVVTIALWLERILAFVANGNFKNCQGCWLAVHSAEGQGFRI